MTTPPHNTRRTLPVVAASEITTAGRTEYVVACPCCRAAHRHNAPGPRRAPCGTRYRLET